MCVSSGNSDEVCIFQAVTIIDDRPAFFGRGFIGKHENAIMFTLRDSGGNLCLQVLGNYNSLFHNHSILTYDTNLSNKSAIWKERN